MTHDPWQLLNCFECLLPYIILDIKDFFLKYVLLWHQLYNNIIGIQFTLSFSLISNNLTNYGRRHFKLFTNCHVLWDTLYLQYSTIKLRMWHIKVATALFDPTRPRKLKNRKTAIYQYWRVFAVVTKQIAENNLFNHLSSQNGMFFMLWIMFIRLGKCSNLNSFIQTTS